jgi:hypothetical protein
MTTNAEQFKQRVAEYDEMVGYIKHRMNLHLRLFVDEFNPNETGGVSTTGFTRLEGWDVDEFEEEVRREVDRTQNALKQLINSHIFVVKDDEDGEYDEYGQSYTLLVSSVWGSEAHKHRIQTEVGDKALDFIQHIEDEEGEEEKEDAQWEEDRANAELELWDAYNKWAESMEKK